MPKPQIKVKVVDAYRNFYEKNLAQFLEKKYEVIFSEQPDFLFYSVYCSELDHFKYDNCVKIFYALEGTIPDFNECDYAIGSFPMDVGDRYLRVPYSKIPVSLNETLSNQKPKERFCNFIYSNFDNGEGALLRQEFCKKLMQYKHVDCPGKVLNNMENAIAPREDRFWADKKQEFLENYKFTIAFENAAVPGMISEKLIQAFQAHSIPIYWGDTTVGDVFDENAFINCARFSSFDEVINRVKEIDNDNTLYRRMLNTPPIKDINFADSDGKIEKFLFSIIEKGNHTFVKDPLNRDSGRLSSLELLDIQKTWWYKNRSFLKAKIEKIQKWKGRRK